MFQGTPHHGSDLASLRSLLEVGGFLGDLSLGYDEALERAIVDGGGQMTFDVQPDSLFLRHLNQDDQATHRERYAIQRGAPTTGRALLLAAGLAAARRLADEVLDRQFPKNQTVLARIARAELDRLRLPAEVASGDLAVTTTSATLDGVKAAATFPLKHTELPHHPDTMKAVLQWLAD